MQSVKSTMFCFSNQFYGSRCTSQIVDDCDEIPRFSFDDMLFVPSMPLENTLMMLYTIVLGKATQRLVCENILRQHNSRTNHQTPYPYPPRSRSFRFSFNYILVSKISARVNERR